MSSILLITTQHCLSEIALTFKIVQNHLNLYVWFGKVSELQAFEEYPVSISFQWNTLSSIRCSEDSTQMFLINRFLIKDMRKQWIIIKLYMLVGAFQYRRKLSELFGTIFNVNVFVYAWSTISSIFGIALNTFK